MRRFHRTESVYLCTRPVDMRRSINGLAGIVQGSFQLDPYEGEPCLSSATGTGIKSKSCNGIRTDLYSTTNAEKKEDSRGLRKRKPTAGSASAEKICIVCWTDW